MNGTVIDFGAMYSSWYRKMAVFLSTFASFRPDEVEDIAHDVLVHAWYRKDRYDPAKPFAPWLYRLARNYAIDYLRRRPATDSFPGQDGRETGATRGSDAERTRNRAFDEAAARLSSRNDPAERAAESELVRAADRAIARLSERDRRVAMLVFYEKMNASEAGFALGLPSGTVRWRVSRIRDRLRKECGIDKGGI